MLGVLYRILSTVCLSAAIIIGVGIFHPTPAYAVGTCGGVFPCSGSCPNNPCSPNIDGVCLCS